MMETCRDKSLEIRLQDYAARSPSHWQTKDRFEISLQP
jgi:hypothetical protein